MLAKYKKQKELKKRMVNQKTICECGYPIPPPYRTFNEFFGGATQVFYEYERECHKCHRINIIIGLYIK
jgi:hypothetical protein